MYRWNQYKSQWESVLSDCPIPYPASTSAATPSTSAHPPGSGGGGLVTATDKQEQMAVVYDYYQKKMSCNVATMRHLTTLLYAAVSNLVSMAGPTSKILTV